MSGNQKPLVSVILPAYNESANAAALIDAIHHVLANHPHEIVFVDDNSPDGTYELVLAKNDPQVRAFKRTTDRGLAKSIRHGIENAKGDVLVVMDSDFNHQPEYIPFMVDSTRYYDCVVASRFQYGGRMDSRARHLMSWIFNIFTRAMTGGMVTDSLYGFFAIRREVMQKLDYNQIFWGYGDYCIRLLYFLQLQGTPILQFPAVNGQRHGGVGNSRFIKVFIQYFTEVCKLAWRERIGKRVPGRISADRSLPNLQK